METKSKFKQLVKGKCPNCGEGRVFQKNKRLFFNAPKMNEDCEHCSYHFDREPGYFLGAMYISYALTVVEGVITFVLCQYLIRDISTIIQLGILFLVLLLLSTSNFKLSRVIYLYIFPW